MRKTTLLLASVMLAFVPALAQGQTGKIHGHIQDPVGVAVADGIVTLTTDGKTPKYTFNTDAGGNYAGDGIAPDTYSLLLRRPDTPKDKILDQIDNVKIVAGQDLLLDDDMGRPDYISKMSPEQRKQVEEVRKKNTDVLKENAQIKNLNANLLQARTDNKNKNFAEAETLMLGATQAKPDASVLWYELGVAQSGLKKFDDAAASLKKSVDLDSASKKPNPDVQGSADNALGEVLANQGKVPDAAAAYDAAAKVNPPQAGMYYANEAIVFSRLNQPDATAAAADKAIEADPKRPIPYYLKGQALINKASVDPKTQKIVAPPGCAEAYQKYLELAPDGPFANEAKSVLAEMGQTVKSSYKASKK
jgi:tetratricopeptide (TPR) repeat protein